MDSNAGKNGESVRALIAGINEVRLENLPASKLEEMEQATANKQAALSVQVNGIRAALDDDLSNNDVIAFEKHQQQARRLESHYDWLEATKLRIFNTRQRVIVRDGMRKVLGVRGCTMLEHAMLVLIMVVLGILLYEMYHDYRLPAEVAVLLFKIDASICCVFLCEFLLRCFLADNKKWFLKSNWVDLASSIPIPPFWVMAPGLDLNTLGRTLRLVRILRLWRAFRILSFMWRGMEKLQQVTDIRLMQKSLLWASAIITLGAIGIHYMNGQNDPHVASLPQSIWWSFNTVATGGFADLYEPEGMLAQLITAVLVIAGFVVMGVFIATLAAAYRGDNVRDVHADHPDLHEDLQNLVRSHRQLRRRLGTIERRLAETPASDGPSADGKGNMKRAA